MYVSSIQLTNSFYEPHDLINIFQQYFNFFYDVIVMHSDPITFMNDLLISHYIALYVIFSSIN